jgi:hypothetical protein
MISRRDLLRLSGLAALAPSFASFAENLAAPDYQIDIAPVTLDLSPRHRLRTTAYNGQVPGAVLRLQENQPVTIEVNDFTRATYSGQHGFLFRPRLASSALHTRPTP